MKIIRNNPVKNLTDIEAKGTLTAVEQSVKEDEMKRQERIDKDFKEKEKFTKDFIKEQDRKTNLKESFAKKIDWSEIANAFYRKLGNEMDLYLDDETERKATRGSYLIKGTIATDKEEKDIELRSDGETLEVAIEDEKFDVRTPDEFVEKIKEIFKDSLQEDMLDDKEVSVKITLKVPARWDYDKTKERIEQALDTYVPLIDITKIEVTDSWRQLANMREERDLTKVEGTIAKLLKDHSAELFSITDARELADKTIDIVRNSEIADTNAAKKFIYIVNSKKNVNTLLSTLAAYMTGMKSISLREKKEPVDVFTAVMRELSTHLGADEKETLRVEGTRGEKYSEIMTDIDGNIRVDAHTISDLNYAKKVADVYHLDFKVKEDKNKKATPHTKYYPYQGIVIIPEEIQEMEVTEYFKQFNEDFDIESAKMEKEKEELRKKIAEIDAKKIQKKREIDEIRDEAEKADDQGAWKKAYELGRKADKLQENK